MNLFLDVEHIRLVHGRVYAHLDSDAITWIYGDNSSIQLVNDVEGQPASQWFAVYRDEAMLEWQPGAWFITQPHAQKGQVSVYRYKSRTSTPEQWQTNCTTWETSWGQDNELVSQLADKFSSVYPLDPARQHYQDWLKNQTDK